MNELEQWTRLRAEVPAPRDLGDTENRLLAAMTTTPPRRRRRPPRWAAIPLAAGGVAAAVAGAFAVVPGHTGGGPTTIEPVDAAQVLNEAALMAERSSDRCRLRASGPTRTGC
jgi:hypothetical protein